MTVEEAAGILRVSVHVVRALIKQGKFAAVLAGREYRINQGNFYAWLNGGDVSGVAACQS